MKIRNYLNVTTLSILITSNPISYYVPASQYLKTSCNNSHAPQPCLDPPKSKWHDGQRRINEAGKYGLLSGVTSWRSCSCVPRGCVNRIRLWPLRRDYRSGVLIGTSGEQRSDWPVHVLANDVSTRIDSPRAKSNRLHACRHKWQLQSVQMLVIK